MRSTTSASMDTPGPFEKAKLTAYYYMTLPDPRWPAAERADFMRQWYFPAIANVSVHEVYPGHYIQFLYAKDFPSDVPGCAVPPQRQEAGALHRADDARRAFMPASQEMRLAQLRTRCWASDYRRHQDARAGHDGGRSDAALRNRRSSAASSGPVGSQAQHRRCALRVLHDGQADLKPRGHKAKGATTPCAASTCVHSRPLPLPLIRRAARRCRQTVHQIRNLEFARHSNSNFSSYPFRDVLVGPSSVSQAARRAEEICQARPSRRRPYARHWCRRDIAESARRGCRRRVEVALWLAAARLIRAPAPTMRNGAGATNTTSWPSTRTW